MVHSQVNCFLSSAINREYSPILSPLTFGVTSVIPEEDEENSAEFRVGEETDDESDSDVGMSETIEHSKNLLVGENAVLRRTELKLPLKPTKADKPISGPKLVGPVGKLLKQDADKSSVGSLDPEDGW